MGLIISFASLSLFINSNELTFDLKNQLIIYYKMNRIITEKSRIKTFFDQILLRFMDIK